MLASGDRAKELTDEIAERVSELVKIFESGSRGAPLYDNQPEANRVLAARRPVYLAAQEAQNAIGKVRSGLPTLFDNEAVHSFARKPAGI
jgi:hypothetical protein